MKAFSISFIFLSCLFGWVFFSTGGVGMEAIERGETTYLEAFGGVLIAIGAMSFWLSMLTHFFKNKDLKHKVLWGFALIFMHVIAAALYFILIVLRNAPKTNPAS